jgi:hypothetical protein
MGSKRDSKKFKVLNDQYIEYDGAVYEKLEGETESIQFTFNSDDDILVSKLKTIMKDDGFVNIQELIRHVIRQEIVKKKGEELVKLVGLNLEE